LPSTVASVGDYTFSGCNSLSNVSYSGTKNPCVSGSTDVFEGCTSLVAIAVPPDYSEDLFCESANVCEIDAPEHLHLASNACVEEYCLYGFKNVRERDNYTKWKSRSNACVEFECDGVFGQVMWSMCNSTEEHPFMCTNDGCNERKEPVSVEIDMEGLNASDFSLSAIAEEIAKISGVDIKNVGYELGDSASIVRVVVVIEDEQTAQLVASAVNNLDKDKCRDFVCSDSEEECKGYICRSKTARVVVRSVSNLDLSEARMVQIGDSLLVIFIFVLFMVTNSFF